MSNLFNSVKGLKPKRNAFSSHSYRNDYTCGLGQLVPIYIQETVPNTSIKVNTHALVRLQALIAPVMDNIDFYVHFWQVPYRLLEKGKFTEFVGGEMDEEDYTPYYIQSHELYDFILSHLAAEDPTMTEEQRIAAAKKIIGDGSLLDMLGYDKKLFFGYNVSIPNSDLNIRRLQAYFFLLKNWYINEHILPWETFVDDVDSIIGTGGSVASSKVALLLVRLYLHMGLFFNHGWSKDYFTSGLPNVQEGEPVTLPIAGNAPVSFTGQPVLIGQPQGDTDIDIVTAETYSTDPKPGHGDQPLYLYNPSAEASSTQLIMRDYDERPISALKGVPHEVGDDPAMIADLTEATAVTINELRVANALQVFKERIMRFGHRSQEYYKGFFNVTPEDLRLQLPKYLGGGRLPINIVDVEQTSATSATSPQGNLAGKAVGVAGSFAGFSTFTSEESIIIGVAWLQPKVTYSNSLSRFLLKLNDRYDYFNPSFEHIGEQEISNIEVFAGGDNTKVFAYTPRFAEYRFHMNEQHGLFKGSLSFWTLGRIFDQQPALNASFIYMQPLALNRIFAVQTDTWGDPIQSVLASVKFDVKVVAPLSKYGTPMLLA